MKKLLVHVFHMRTLHWPDHHSAMTINIYRTSNKAIRSWAYLPVGSNKFHYCCELVKS